MARIVFPSATMTWFRLPRGPSLNFLGASGTCSDSLLIKASQIHIPLYQTVVSQGDYSCLWIPAPIAPRIAAPARPVGLRRPSPFGGLRQRNSLSRMIGRPAIAMRALVAHHTL